MLKVDEETKKQNGVVQDVRICEENVMIINHCKSGIWRCKLVEDNSSYVSVVGLALGFVVSECNEDEYHDLVLDEEVEGVCVVGFVNDGEMYSVTC